MNASEPCGEQFQFMFVKSMKYCPAVRAVMLIVPWMIRRFPELPFLSSPLR